MILKPIDRVKLTLIDDDNTFYDEYGNQYFDIIRRISVNSEENIGRLERISLARSSFDPKFINIFKESAIGNIINDTDYGPELIFDNYVYSTSDICDGSYIQSGGYCSFPPEQGSFSAFGYLQDMPVERIQMNDESYKKRTLASLEHITLTVGLMDIESIEFENEYQLPYTETIGLLNIFFSTWTYGYPFETIVIIDCKRKGFNVPKIRYLPFIDKEHMKAIYITFIQEIDKISNYIFNITEREKRNIKFLVFLHPFGTMIKIKDLDRHTIENVKNYNADQPHTVMKNVITGGAKYVFGESFGLLSKGQLGEPVVQALECSDIFY
jgi:hypothetical protein